MSDHHAQEEEQFLPSEPRRRESRRRTRGLEFAGDRAAVPGPRSKTDSATQQHDSSPSKYKEEDHIDRAQGAAVCQTPLFHRVSKETGEILGIVGCKSRYCPACGPRLKASHIAHFVEVGLGLPDLLFLTLTLDPKAVLDHSASTYADLLVSTWTAFMKNLGERSKRAGVRRHYFGVVEGLGEGWPHIHAILSCPLENAEGMVEELWFKQGGGIVMEVTPVASDEEEIARLVGYMLKEQFSEGVPRRNLLTSDGIGYNSAEAKRRRREHVIPDGDDVILDRVRDAEPRPKRSPSKRRKRTEGLLAPDRRSTAYVRRREGTDFGIRTTISEQGKMRRDVVRIEWDDGKSTPTYTTLREDVGDSAAAAAEIDRLIAGNNIDT